MAIAVVSIAATAETFVIDGTDYDYNVLTKRSIGPGVEYTRLRIPDFPLNVNYLVVDLTNPYNSIETQQGGEKTGSTELLASAYKRMQNEGKKPLGAQNGNFWVVSGQWIYSQFALGTTFNACLKNGKIITETNCHADQWDGGPARTGVVGIDADKTLHIESMKWRGYAKSATWGDAQHEFYLANKFCRSTGEMVLYNSYYGNTKKFQTIEEDNGTWKTVDNKSCEVYINLDEGQQWATTTDIVGTVMQVRTDCAAGTLGDYDACLVGSGGYKTALEQLKPGDKITLNYTWQSVATGNDIPLTQAIGGNAMVMIDGELTGRNEDETYNSQIYSRSAYGMSQDGKTLYMFVIDKSLDPTYGNSAGCTTSVMCQIMKQLGAWTVCNVDAGGSAQLMVEGNVVNKTTESTPRPVANGWMVYSVAPDDEQSDVITRIEFLDPELNLPVYTSYRPTILGYNCYGELIDSDVQGFTLQCDPAFGETVGDTFNVSGNIGATTLTASIGDISVTKDVNVVSAQVELRLKNILIDNREYPIEVNASTLLGTYPCDPTRLQWTVADESVATITNGVLRGVANGTTTITGTISEFTTTANVTVEIPESTTLPIFTDFEQATVSQTGGTGATVTKDGNGFKINYTGNGTSRGAYLQVLNDSYAYSLPYALRITVNPGKAIIKGITISGTNALGVSIPVFTINLPEGMTQLPADTDTTIDVPVDEWSNPDDIGVYPLQLHYLRFAMGASTKNEEFEINVREFAGIYNKDAAVTTTRFNSSALKAYPNPTDGIVTLTAPGIERATVTIYSSTGANVLSQNAEFIGGSHTLNLSNLAPGIYFVRIVSEGKAQSCRIIVK